MPIVNGKIIRDKPKKKKCVIEEQKEKATKRLRDKALGKKEKEPKKVSKILPFLRQPRGIQNASSFPRG